MAPVGLVYAASSVLGPLVGGSLTETVGWRWIFWVNVPLGAVAIALAFRSVPHPTGPRAHGRLDVPGSFLYVAAVTGLVVLTGTLGRELSLDLAGSRSWASSSTSLCGLLFVVRMLRHDDPLIPVGVLRNRLVVVACCLGFAVGAAVFALVGYIPTIVQEVLVDAARLFRRAAAGAGARNDAVDHDHGTVDGADGPLPPPPAGRLRSPAQRHWPGSRASTRRGAPGAPAPRSSSSGVGVGCFMMLVVTIAQDAVAAELVGSATSTVNLVRELGVTIGAATIGSVLAVSITPRLPALFLTLAAVFVVGAGLSLLLPDTRPCPIGASERRTQ